MKNNKIFVFACGLSALALAACSDDGESGQKVAAGDAVSFSLYQNETRTVYDTDDDLQIDWLWDQDKVRVYCDKTSGLKQADYVVAQKTEGEDKDTKHIGKLKHEEGLLLWGEAGDYDFYAAYPADDSRVTLDPSTGVATFTVNWNQNCTITGDADANGNYEAAPDMTNAYMVAHSKVAAYNENVDLHFDPIMTTLKVVVKGKEDQNEEGVTITGISIVNSNVVSSDANQGQFQYDINQKKVVNNTASTSTKTETTFCGVSHTTTDGTTENFIELESGQTVTFTVFLPPLDINAEKQITIRVHATGATTQQVTFGSDTQSVPASYKTKITLPYFPTESDGNNWITPLDDDIYVSQLSIPGTHDAATGEGMNSGIGEYYGNTQNKTIKEQISMGIRAFDLRPAYVKESYGNVSAGWQIFHGATATVKTLKSALEDLTGYLAQNKGEFFIVWMRHENDKVLNQPSQKDTSHWTDYIKDAIEESTGKDYIVSFKPDLTIGEARGKILFLTRDDFTGRDDLGAGFVNPYTSGATTVKYDGAITGKSQTAALHYQDMYNDLNETNKIALVKELLNASAKYWSDGTNTLTWVVNHTSGYTNSSTFGISSTQNYLNNAVNTNKPFYDYLVGDKPVGGTGIIFSDFVGSRTIKFKPLLIERNYTVYGDLLPQAIIDNNYKYRMKRKGE